MIVGIEVDADGSDCAVDALAVKADDLLDADKAFEFVCGSKPLTTTGPPFIHLVKPRKSINWDAALVLNELGFIPAALSAENVVGSEIGFPVVVIHLVVPEGESYITL